MSSFWEAKDLIPIGQKKISIQAENGLEYSLGQKINFVIPASTGFMMPSETYLRMDVKVQCPADLAGRMTRLQLDGETGCNVLIRDIRISSGAASNILLEEIQNANILTALRYDYESNDNLKAKRALTEGTQMRSNANRSTKGTSDTIMNNCTENPYFPEDETTINDPVVTDFFNSKFQTVKGLIKLPTGIFQNDRIFPLMMTDGLRIEIILESAERSVRCLENTMLNSRATCNPLFHSIDGIDAAPSEWPVNGQPGSTQTAFFLQRANGVNSVATTPFVVGETIGLVDLDTGGIDYGAAFDMEITSIEHVADGVVGNQGVNVNSGLVKISFVGTNNISAGAVTPGADVAVYSKSVAGSLADNVAGTPTFVPTATVNNVELIVQQVTMPDGYTSKMMNQLKSGGVMQYDFLSFTNYKYSQAASERVTNIRIPIMNSRCKGVLAIPCDSTVYTPLQALDSGTTYKVNEIQSDSGDNVAVVNNSTRSGIVGIADNASDYQFIYDGQLNPNRKVPLSRQSHSGVLQAVNQQVFIEQEKALHVCGIDPLSFEKWQENFFIGRAFTLGNGVYDARGKDFSLQVEYLEATAPQKAKLWNLFVGHVRRIVVKGDGISLEV
mgnify:CR=1 FL=1